MTDQNWLRDALRRATADQPDTGDRVRAALARAARRRQQRTAAISCVAAVAAVALIVGVTGGPGSSSLRPVSTPTPSAGTPEPEPSSSPSPHAPNGGASPAPSAQPSRPAASPTPSPAASVRYLYPEVPRALDVYVLLDATATMDTAGSLVRAALDQLVRQLRASKHDVQVGLGIFRDIGSVDSESPTDTRVYRRVVPIGGRWTTEDVQFFGGGDEPEAQTMALRGVVGYDRPPHVRPGDAVSFRPGASRVVVLVTDSTFHAGGQYPTKAEAIQTLLAHDVKVAGLMVDTSTDAEAARADVTEVVDGTHGHVRAGFDCDGDGFLDVASGAPLVCALTDDVAGFAFALLNLLPDDPGTGTPR